MNTPVSNHFSGRPYRSLLIVIFIIFPLVNFHFVLDAALTPRFFGWGLLVLGLSLYFSIRSPDKNFEAGAFLPKGLLFAFLAYLLISIISLRDTINFSEGIYEVSKISLQFLFLVFLFLFFRKRPDNILLLLKFMHIAILLFAAYGFYQLYLMYTSSYRTLIDTYASYSIHDISSTLGNKNLYAEILLLLLPFVLLGISFFNSKWRWISYADLSIIISHLIILQSITVWLALVVSLLCTFAVILILRKHLQDFHFISFFKGRNFIVSFIVILSLMVAAIFVYINSEGYKNLRDKIAYLVNFEKQKKLSNENPYTISNSVFDRTLMYRNSIKLIREHPLWGAGISNWEVLHPRYGMSGIYYLNAGVQLYEHPHNDFLLILSETGIAGLFIYLLIFAIPILYSIRILKSTASSSDKLFILMALAGIIIYAVISFFSFPKMRIFHLLLFDIILALIAAKYVDIFPASSAFSGRYFRWIFLAGMPVSLFCSIVGFYRLQGEIHFQKAVTAQFSQQWETMIREIDKAHSAFYSIDYTTTPILWYRGLANFYANKVDLAFQDFKNAEKAHPYHLHLLNNIGSCYELKGDRNNAVKYYRKALAINPDFTDALINLSITYYHSGKIEDAYSVISRYPESDHARYREVVTAVLYSKGQNLYGTLSNEQEKSYLANQLKDARWLWEINRKALESGQSFEDMVRKNIKENTVE